MRKNQFSKHNYLTDDLMNNKIIKFKKCLTLINGNAAMTAKKHTFNFQEKNSWADIKMFLATTTPTPSHSNEWPSKIKFFNFLLKNIFSSCNKRILKRLMDIGHHIKGCSCKEWDIKNWNKRNSTQSLGSSVPRKLKWQGKIQDRQPTVQCVCVQPPTDN